METNKVELAVQLATLSSGHLLPLREYQKFFSYRCNQGRTCGRFVPAHADHPIFTAGSGAGRTSLQDQAALLMGANYNMKHADLHLLTNANHKSIEALCSNLDKARALDVKHVEKNIVFGTADKDWKDVEADEVDLRGELDSAASDDNKKKMWEQWGGVVERGRRQSLTLARLNPKSTPVRAPGPGPIRLLEWKSTASKRLRKRNIILHTDGAKSYNLEL